MKRRRVRSAAPRVRPNRAFALRELDHDAVALRSHERWLARGCPFGGDARESSDVEREWRESRLDAVIEKRDLKGW